MEQKKIIEINLPAEIYFDLGLKSHSFENCIVFNSINNILYLIHSFDYKIYLYDLNKKTILSKIKLDGEVKSLKHLFDEEKKRDILMIVYWLKREFYVKLYNIIKFECILSLNFEAIDLIEACFLRDKNEYYVAVGDSKTFYSNWNDNVYDDSHEIQVYDFKKNRIKEIKGSAHHTYYISTYYEYNRIYIITENHDCLRSIYYNDNELYRKYENAKFFYGHIIQGKDLITRLIAKSDSSLIEIFNFHTGSLLIKIDIRLLNLAWLRNNGSILILENGHYKMIDLLNNKISDAILYYTYLDTGNMKHIKLNDTHSLLISTKDDKINIMEIKIIK